MQCCELRRVQQTARCAPRLVRCRARVGAHRRRHGNDAHPAAGTQLTRARRAARVGGTPTRQHDGGEAPVRASYLTHAHAVDERVGEEVEQRQKVDDVELGHDHRVRQPAQTSSRLQKLE